jgi:arsenical pump membrane protein
LTFVDWAIAALAIVAVLLRPFGINEAWWAAAGAAALVVAGAIAPQAALAALARGADVYLFLIGMMLLAEVARAGGVFAWVAARAVVLAGQSRMRLFAIVFLAGIVTTALLSNDATIVVLTPAVIDALQRVDAPPLAYVIACALVANAASFLLPIANPSNLLVFAHRMPSLGAWLATFALPSVAALAVTFAVLSWWYRRDLAGTWPRSDDDGAVAAPKAAIVVALVLAASAIVTTSAREGPLGIATFACAVLAWIVAAFVVRGEAVAVFGRISWPVVALTAALFVIVAAVDAGGGFTATRAVLEAGAKLHAPWAAVAIGFAVGAASNIVNNLPVGLNLGQTLPTMHAPATVTSAALIGVNLGPNATINGSLATLLWLTIVRRARIDVSPLQFAVVGIATTLPALLAALLCVR